MLGEKQLQEMRERADNATISEELPDDDIPNSALIIIGVLSDSVDDVPALLDEVERLNNVIVDIYQTLAK